MREVAARRLRERWSLGCAVALHTLVLVALHGALAGDDVDSASPRAAEPKSNFDEIDIDWSGPAPTAPEPSVVDPEERLAPRRIVPPREAARTRAYDSAHEELGASAAPSESQRMNAGDTESPTAEIEEPQVARQPIDLGIQGEAWKRWVERPGTPGPDRSTGERRGRPLFEMPNASSTGGIQEGLEKRDRMLGVSPSGRVVNAFHEAAHSHLAPRLGRARFHVTVLRTGAVEISLGQFTNDAKGWKAVAEHAAQALRRKMPRLSAARKGMRVTIEVIAEETYPNGVKPRDLHGPRFEVKPPEFKSVDTVKKQLEKENQPVAKGEPPRFELPFRVELPGVYLSGKGKVCSYAVGITPFGFGATGGCDPSNGGAKPQRMIRARVEEEAMF